MAFVVIPCVACGNTGGGGIEPPRFDAEQMFVCDVGLGGELLGTAIMVSIYNNQTGQADPPLPYDLVTGLPYVVQGTLQPCPISGDGGGGTPAVLDSTVQRQTGAGNIVIAGGARSVTLTVLTGDASVDLGQGATLVPAGNAISWSVDAAGETLADTFTFVGIAGSDFLVHSTRV